MENTKTASQILNEAADYLEQGKLVKGTYFRQYNEGYSMCAHGAIAYCGDSKVKIAVDVWDRKSDYNDLTIPVNKNIFKRDYVLYTLEDAINERNPVALAHVLASNCGLTASYNDRPDTTKQDVVNKLREAAKTAEQFTI